MKRRVYLETSVISYLASRPSRDLVTAGRQQLTHRWWETQRLAFDLVASHLRRRVDRACRDLGYEAPILCTPDELMEDADE